MAFEDLLPLVGHKGRFQILQALSLAVALIFLGTHFLIENITAFVPEHRCWTPLLDNTSALLNVSGNLNFSSLLKFSIPLDSNGKLEKCCRFFWPQGQPLLANVTGQNLSQLEMEPCVDGWVYDQSTITSSIVTEWDLVCDSWTLTSLSQSLFLAGILMGYLIGGYLSDRFGRKRTLSPSFFTLAVSSTGVAFAPSFQVYCCCRFLLGFSISGVLLGGGSLIMEWSTTQHRHLVAIMLSMSISLGHLFLGFLTYGIKDWRKLQLVVSVPLFAFFLITWWLPESPRWLIVHNKYNDALKVLRKVSKINGVKEQSVTAEALRSTMGKEVDAAPSSYTILDLVRFPILCKRTLCVSFKRFSIGMLFYGLSLDLQNLGHNIQMLQVILGASNFLSRFGTLFIMNCLGRRTIVVASFLLPGLFILSSTFLPQGILHAVLAMLAINCIVVCISCDNVYSVELLPTVVRNKCMGLSLTIDRLGAMLAPMINMLKHNIPAMPQIIFAIMAITSSLIVFFFLPETKNKPMPDTIQDLECGHSREEARPRDEGETLVKINQSEDCSRRLIENKTTVV
ncbi:steroid transmembrane transporter SLC22A24-like [Dromiciops gliroides]|uniref:steroid transmembrane transporter SLC22A24-like n=1 Tax=Dromiciops gliroides TaxID=33562 RepID=UPI001CC8157B|nr:steroid transmembrane transporter SLC22A24-like [Dromiciops gliroides]